MDLVIRGLAVYLFLLLIFRVSGKRSLRSATTFDLPRVDRLLEGHPLVILRNGVPLRARMHVERVDDDDILSAARVAHGIDRLDDIERAVLEKSGGISIVPRRGVES